MSSFHYDFSEFQNITISAGDNTPYSTASEDKFTAKWGGIGDLDFLIPLSNFLYLADYMRFPVERIDDENGNLAGISFSLDSSKVIIQKDDCGYLEVLDGDGEPWRIDAIPCKLARILLASQK